MQLDISEKRGWVSDLIFRELRRFEEDTRSSVERVIISRIDNRLTSVNLEVRKVNNHES